MNAKLKIWRECAKCAGPPLLMRCDSTFVELSLIHPALGRKPSSCFLLKCSDLEPTNDNFMIHHGNRNDWQFGKRLIRAGYSHRWIAGVLGIRVEQVDRWAEAIEFRDGIREELRAERRAAMRPSPVVALASTNARQRPSPGTNLVPKGRLPLRPKKPRGGPLA